MVTFVSAACETDRVVSEQIDWVVSIMTINVRQETGV